MSTFGFSSDLPFTLFNKDSNQYSWQDLSEDNKKFFWHQFLLNVLLDIPRSLTSKEDILKAVRQYANEEDLENGIKLNQTILDEFQLDYTPENVIEWYTRDSFFYRILNKACRTLNTDAIISFHPIIKDLTYRLKQLQLEQQQSGVLKFPLTVYRAQVKFGIGEIERIRTNTGNLISMNTFLSTTTHSHTVVDFLADADKNTTVLFQIKIHDFENLKSSQIFANITEDSKLKDEKEVLFGMSSVFKLVSVENEDWGWVVNLELTSCEEDKDMQKFMNETKTYLNQISSKSSLFLPLKQLFNTVSLTDIIPFIELLKYYLVDMGQLFVLSMYQKEGRTKELIDMESVLKDIATKKNSDVVYSNQTFIYLLIDLLNNLCNPNESKTEKENEVSLLCFGGFLFLTGDCDKAIQYFQMLLKYESISKEFKTNIHALLAASYAAIKEKELAANYLNHALQSPIMSPWLAASIVSTNSTMDVSNQHANEILDQLKLLMNKEQSNNDVHEKFRLLYLGHICSQEEKFVYALNRWEEALEITSYIPSSMVTILNGAIHLQMAVAYFRLNNLSKTLKAMENVQKNLGKYYPSTHRLFGTINFLHGFYLIHNEESSQAILCLKKALENPYFSNDQQFHNLVQTFLIIAYIQSNQFDLVEEYVRSGFPTMISQVLEELPDIKMITNYQNSNYAREYITNSFRLGPQLLAQKLRDSMLPPRTINEENYTMDQCILMADYYRHQEDHTRALAYYSKALEKTTEMDSKDLWNIYKKMRRMNEYGDCFSLLYSKYEDGNPKDFQIISILQIILYKINLSQHEFELAFNCLIHGTFMMIKCFFHQFNIDSISMRNWFSHQQFIQIILLLMRSIRMYSMSKSTIVQDFFSDYFHSSNHPVNLPKIIHHVDIDDFLFYFRTDTYTLSLSMLIEILRQSISPSEQSTLSIKDEISEFLQHYNEQNTSLFYLMKIFQSILMNDIQNFIANLDQFQQNIVTFEHYNKLKAKFSEFFEQVDENFLQNIENYFN